MDQGNRGWNESDIRVDLLVLGDCWVVAINYADIKLVLNDLC